VRSKEGEKDDPFYLMEKTKFIRASSTTETEGSAKWHSRYRNKYSDEKEKDKEPKPCNIRDTYP